MVLLDTCALLWWTLDPEKLSPKAAKICGRLAAEGGSISSISLWEIGIKIKNHKLDIGMTIREYADRLRSMGILEILPVTDDVWIANLELDWAHRDPADRTIVATAKLKNLPIMTCDKPIRKFYKKTVW